MVPAIDKHVTGMKLEMDGWRSWLPHRSTPTWPCESLLEPVAGLSYR